MNFLRRLFGMKPKQPRSPGLRRPTPRPPVPPRPERTPTALPPPLHSQPKPRYADKVFYRFTCTKCRVAKYTSWETYARKGICYTCTDFPKYCECGHGITKEEYNKCYSCAVRDGGIIIIDGTDNNARLQNNSAF